MERLMASLAAALLVAVPVGDASGQTQEEAVWQASLPVADQSTTDLSLFRNGRAYAFQSNGKFHRSDDFGKSWLPMPLLEATIGMEFSTPNTGFAIGGSIYRSEDEGLTWAALPGPRAPSAPKEKDNDDWNRIGYDAVTTVKGTDMVVVGGQIAEYRNGCPTVPRSTQVFVSKDKGDSWRTTHLPLWGQVKEIRFLDKRHGLLLAWEFELTEKRECGWTGVSFRTLVMATHDGGKTWKTIRECPHGEDIPTCFAIAILTPDKYFIGMTTGLIIGTTNGGRTWKNGQVLQSQSEERSGVRTGFWIEAIEFANRRIGYAATNGYGTWRTTDGGRTWTREVTPQESPGLSFGDLAVADEDHAVAGGPHAVITRVPIAP